ncbi:MAG: outer membrane beta-barrel protein [Acidobacteriota bacterium]
MFYRSSLKLLALTVLVLGCMTAVPQEASAQEAVCEGFDRKQRIGRLGGRTAFSKDPVASPADLHKQLEAHRSEIETIMRDKGVGHLVDALYSAVASGDGLSERDLERGEVFEWMTFRKRRGATTLGPMCFAARKSYSAYEILVTEEENKPAKADCALAVSGGACVEEPIKVDATGSSKGVTAEMSGPGGSKSLLSGGSTTWSGTVGAPGSYTVTAKAQAQGTKMVTTHTFVIPKACLNLAYLGHKKEEKPGEVSTCSESASVKVADCTASLNVTVEPAEVRRGEEIQVNISGTYDSAKVTFEKDGEAVEAHSGGQSISELTESGAVSFKKSGTYQFNGTAVRCKDLPGKCAKSVDSAPVTVEVKSAWTARFFGLSMDLDDDSLDQSEIRPDGLLERSVLKFEKGRGAGAGLEYHFNDRVGLEASILYAAVESKLFFDIGSDWAEDDDDSSLLAFLIGPNFHLTPNKNVDVYFGPFVGYAVLGDASFRVLGENQRRSYEADTVIGVQLGVDVPFGERGWAVHFGARYMDASVEVDGIDLDVNPLTAGIGLAYKF